MNTIEKTPVYNYVSTVYNNFLDNPEVPSNSTLRSQVIDFFIEVLNKDKGNCKKAEALASKILSDFPNIKPGSSKKRYQLGVTSNRDTLLKHIFDHSFRYNADSHIAAAELLDKEDGGKGSFYPAWKKVCWIQIPTVTANVVGSTLFRIAVSIYVLTVSYTVLHQVSAATTLFVSAKALPFFINNTPLVIIRGVNALIAAREAVVEYAITTIIGVFIIQSVLRCLPEIPYVTRVAREIHVLAVINWVFFAPASLGWFVFLRSVDAGIFVWNSFGTVSDSIRRIAQIEDNIRLSECKSKAYEVWQKVIKENEPPFVDTPKE